MHYKIKLDKEIIIKSENAAKSVLQQNKKLLKYLECIPKEAKVLDYGCGKLRYSLFFLHRGNKVCAVDSSVQISRKQKINTDSNVSIIDIKKSFEDLEVYLIDEFKMQKEFEWAICTNVLSAIPFEQVRFDVLKNIKKSLKIGGKLILSLQYRNSYFKSYEKRENAVKYGDGWILENNNNYTFYGIIPPEKIKHMCETLDFKILEEKIIDGSIILKLENSL
ncbi:MULTISPECIES: class I SAM-dependent methyltransferase [unclassified Bacillus (in: firmicutes)]|uniref:class I SAM-dependent methyltransferase n=1 Tax=unclassified Bacillus (in: firmicutes) TaxID=185979 RepID=UPI00178C65B9|nr:MULTISPECIES: class I SAM-dependent methyltransferase [unclassified Bacillus (in: firmicutes)]